MKIALKSSIGRNSFSTLPCEQIESAIPMTVRAHIHDSAIIRFARVDAKVEHAGVAHAFELLLGECAAPAAQTMHNSG